MCLYIGFVVLNLKLAIIFSELEYYNTHYYCFYTRKRFRRLEICSCSLSYAVLINNSFIQVYYCCKKSSNDNVI